MEEKTYRMTVFLLSFIKRIPAVLPVYVLRRKMRIWDINPGYLNNRSLLGEHRELHGIVSIMINNKKGYSRHPETLRWLDYGWALTIRHDLLVSEMRLRGFNEKTPVNMERNEGLWPSVYIDNPHTQFKILTEKYKKKDEGRIRLPKTPQELWRHHKYSIMARDVGMYKKIGSYVAGIRPREDFSDLSQRVTEKLRCTPSPGGITNAVQHMWGYVKKHYSGSKKQISTWSVYDFLDNTQKIAVKINEPYLMSSTALSELKIWL